MCALRPFLAGTLAEVCLSICTSWVRKAVCTSPPTPTKTVCDHLISAHRVLTFVEWGSVHRALVIVVESGISLSASPSNTSQFYCLLPGVSQVPPFTPLALCIPSDWTATFVGVPAASHSCIPRRPGAAKVFSKALIEG